MAIPSYMELTPAIMELTGFTHERAARLRDLTNSFLAYPTPVSRWLMKANKSGTEFTEVTIMMPLGMVLNVAKGGSYGNRSFWDIKELCVNCLCDFYRSKCNRCGHVLEPYTPYLRLTVPNPREETDEELDARLERLTEGTYTAQDEEVTKYGLVFDPIEGREGLEKYLEARFIRLGIDQLSTNFLRDDMTSIIMDLLEEQARLGL